MAVAITALTGLKAFPQAASDAVRLIVPGTPVKSPSLLVRKRYLSAGLAFHTPILSERSS